MTKGWGPCNSQGGGCTLPIGAVTGAAKLAAVALGRGARPVGLEIPLLNGTYEAPAGFGTNSGCIIIELPGDFGTGKNWLSDAGSVGPAGAGLSNCRKRSMAASCSSSDLVVCGEGWEKVGQLKFLPCTCSWFWAG